MKGGVEEMGNTIKAKHSVRKIACAVLRELQTAHAPQNTSRQLFLSHAHTRLPRWHNMHQRHQPLRQSFFPDFSRVSPGKM